MSVVRALGWFIVAIIVVLVSMPWLMLSMGYGIAGDDVKEDWWFSHAPISLLMDARERHA